MSALDKLVEMFPNRITENINLEQYRALFRNAAEGIFRCNLQGLLLESNPSQEWVSLLPDYIDISPFAAGVATIGFIFGAYMTETFRGAILAVDKGELEAARAFGMRASQVFVRILFPQMMRHALPGFGNNWLVLLKTTALVSIIGLDDMVRKASLAAGSTQQPFTFYMAVALIFLVFTAVSTSALKWAERHYAIKTR